MKLPIRALIGTFVTRLAITSLLLTIDWFTWGAWLFVGILLTWWGYVNWRREQYLFMLYQNFIEILKEIVEQHDTRLSSNNKNWRRSREE